MRVSLLRSVRPRFSDLQLSLDSVLLKARVLLDGGMRYRSKDYGKQKQPNTAHIIYNCQ